jgi:hypothetical protein
MIHPKIERILLGIQAGMLGGLAMTAVLAILALFDLRPWWATLNIIAAVFYGPRALTAGVGWTTAAGAALQLSIAGVGGALFALVFGNVSRSAKAAFLGIFWAIVIFFVSGQVYGAIAPVVQVHLPRGAAMTAHLVYGLFLTGVLRKHGGGKVTVIAAGSKEQLKAPEPVIAADETGANRAELPGSESHDAFRESRRATETPLFPVE